MARVKAATKPAGEYVVIRSDRAGCFAGTLVSRTAEACGVSVVLADARRLWYWDGAASLSEIATKGVSRPAQCKFPAPVERIEVNGVIEVIATTLEARKSIEGVTPWTQH